MRPLGASPAASTALTVMEPVPPTASSSTHPVDVAILIALKEEWDVFWSIAGQPPGIKDDVSGRYLFHFEVPSLIGRPYRCVAVCMGDMGPGQATDATHLLLRTKPRTLVNVGIAAAIHDDLKLCDVVVAEQIDDYLATVKAVAKGNDEWAFESRGSVYKATYSLVQDVNNLKYAHPEAFAAWHTACTSAMTERADKLATARKTEQLHEAPALTMDPRARWIIEGARDGSRRHDARGPPAQRDHGDARSARDLRFWRPPQVEDRSLQRGSIPLSGDVQRDAAPVDDDAPRPSATPRTER